MALKRIAEVPCGLTNDLAQVSIRCRVPMIGLAFNTQCRNIYTWNLLIKLS